MAESAIAKGNSVSASLLDLSNVDRSVVPPNNSATMPPRVSTTYKTLSEEISDALEKIKNDPHEPNGYTLAGKLYSCQGNQQEAISVLEQGLRAVCTDHHLILQQQIDAAKSQLDRRIDFITECPFEVFCNIASEIAQNQEALLKCLDVGPAWRRKLLEHPPVWHSISLDKSNGPRLFQVFPSISKYVGRMSIVPHHLMSSGKRHLVVLQYHEFPNLKALRILTDDNHIWNKKEDVAGRFIFNGLSYVGSTLEELELTVPSVTKIQMQRLMATCPNLRSLKLKADTISDRRDGIRLQNTTYLTRFELISSKPIPYTMLSTMFRRSPRLQHLLLFIQNDEDDFLPVLNHCLELEDIRMGSPDRDTFYPDHTAWENYQAPSLSALSSSSATASSTTPSASPAHLLSSSSLEATETTKASDAIEAIESTGAAEATESSDAAEATGSTSAIEGTEEEQAKRGQLRFLIMRNVRSALPLAPRLQKSSDTLRELILNMSEAIMYTSSLLDWEPLSSTTMNQLTKLTIRNGCRAFYGQLPFILPRLPALKSLHLQHSPWDMLDTDPEDRTTRDNVFLALAGLRGLTDVYFDEFDVRGQGFERFLTMGQQEDTERNLHGLHFSGCIGLTHATLLLVAKVKSLRRLTISIEDSYRKRLKNKHLEEFTQCIGQLPELTSLELHNFIMNEKGALNISASEKLSKVVLGTNIDYMRGKVAVRKVLFEKSRIPYVEML